MPRARKSSHVVPKGGEDLIVVTSDDNFLSQSSAQVARIFGLPTDRGSFAAPEHGAVLGLAGHDSGNSAAVVSRGFSRVGYRHFVPPGIGSGYWDFFRPLPHTMLSVTDCEYAAPYWAPVQGEHVFKIRLVCSGCLLDAGLKPIVQGPAQHFSFHPRTQEWGYYFAAGAAQRIVIVHFAPEAIIDTLGLRLDDVPTRCRAALETADAPPLNETAHLGGRLLEAALDILESRFRFNEGLRINFLEAKCREILTLVLNEARSRELDDTLGHKVTTRDRLLIGEASDYLSENFRSPPAIPLLARRIGMNQTKLKALFKRVTGSTIHDFVQNIRMRHAAAMLSSGEHSISQVAYEVGYEHPANFTTAFKRHFGFLPRVMKPQQNGGRES